MTTATKNPTIPLRSTRTREADFLIESHGSIFGFTPLNASARAWLDTHTNAEGWQYMGASLMVEHRYAMQLADGIQEAGYRVE